MMEHHCCAMNDVPQEFHSNLWIPFLEPRAVSGIIPTDSSLRKGEPNQCTSPLRRQGGGTHTCAASILKALQMAPEVLCLCAWHDSAGIRRSRTYVLPVFSPA